MTKIEKGMIIGLVVGLLMFVGGIASTVHSVNKAGGIKQVIIDTGKEIKDIKEQINEEK